jgi:hypothetical protein
MKTSNVGQNVQLYGSAYRIALKHISPRQKREQPNVALRLHAALRRQIEKGKTDPALIATDALRDVEFNPETWD